MTKKVRRLVEGMIGLNVTDAKRARIPLLRSTVRETDHTRDT